MTALITQMRELFPNAETRWVGREDPDSAIVEWLNCTFVATRAEGYGDPDIYMVGVYPDDEWNEGFEPEYFVDIKGVDCVVHYVDWMTDNQPEGTDFGAWAVQWTMDQDADGIEGAVPFEYRRTDPHEPPRQQT